MDNVKKGEGGRVVCVVAVGLLLSAGCGASTGRPDYSSEDLSLIDATAEVDVDTGRIVLPVERYLLSPEEEALIRSADALEFQQCAAGKGDVFEWEPVLPSEISDRRYGVWRADRVAQFGYALDESDALTELPSVDGPELEMTPSEYEKRMKIVEECGSSPDHQKLRTDTISLGFDYPTELQWITDEVFASDAGVEVFDDWEACLNRKGLERDEAASPFAVRGASVDITENNIKIAVADVACKDEVDFVRRLADLEAAEQAPIVAHFRKELSAYRAELDGVLMFAEQYLAANAP